MNSQSSAFTATNLIQPRRINNLTKNLIIEEHTGSTEGGATDDNNLSPKSKENLKHALERLKQDQKTLCKRVQDLIPIYGDNKIEENIQKITSILELALHQVSQHAIDSSRPLWRETMIMLRETLLKYTEHLENAKGRRDLKEARECLDQVTVLLQCVNQRTTAADIFATKKSKDEDWCERLTCCVCLDATVSVSITCGHLLCSECAQSVEVCPLCRKRVKAEEIRSIYF